MPGHIGMTVKGFIILRMPGKVKEYMHHARYCFSLSYLKKL